MDWLDQTRTDVIEFLQVSPTNINDVRGTLTGVDLGASTLTASYYTDTRTSGVLRLCEESWIRGSFIRVVHRVPEWDYRNELGTYIVTDDSADRHCGEWHYDLQLQSILYGLSTHLGESPATIPKGGNCLAAMRQILKSASRPYIEKSPRDAKAQNALVFDTGTSMLSRLFELCSMANDRLDVDGHGNVTISPYVELQNRPSVLTISLEDVRGIAKDDLSRTTNWLELPGEVVVSHKYSESGKDAAGKSVSVEKEIRAVAKSTKNPGPTTRGYYVVDYHSLSELSPRTQQAAQQKAKQYLDRAEHERVEWQLTTMYLPVWEGDVITLLIPDGVARYQGARKCLVKNVELDLLHMTMQLTLKETASGDWEDGDDIA